MSRIEIQSTNEPLDCSEHIHLKFLTSHITKFQAEIGLMNKGALSTKLVFHTLMNLWRKHVDHICGLQVALVPHKKLPPELLSKIFLYGLDQDGVEIPDHLRLIPWNVTCICSAWHHIALREH